MQYSNEIALMQKLPEYIGGGKHTCQLCKEEIFEGDTFYKIKGQRYHSSCLTEAYTKEELLALLDVKPQIAINQIKVFVIGEKNGK